MLAQNRGKLPAGNSRSARALTMGKKDNGQKPGGAVHTSTNKVSTVKDNDPDHLLKKLTKKQERTARRLAENEESQRQAAQPTSGYRDGSGDF